MMTHTTLTPQSDTLTPPPNTLTPCLNQSNL